MGKEGEMVVVECKCGAGYFDENNEFVPFGNPDLKDGRDHKFCIGQVGITVVNEIGIRTYSDMSAKEIKEFEARSG